MYSLFSSFLTVILFFCCLILYASSLAGHDLAGSSSPSFERQEIDDVDNHTDWFFWPSRESEAVVNGSNGEFVTIPYATNYSACDFGDDISPQIESVSYSSDGSELNVTLWLSSQLLEENIFRNEINKTNMNSDAFLPLWKIVKFVVVIDVKSTFNKGIDYRIEFSGKPINHTENLWLQELYEISLDGATKKTATKIFSGFPDGNEYLDFSIDLNRVSHPQEYNILSYVVDSYLKNGQYCRMVDSTNWILIPPPSFDMYLSPPSLQMRPGDTENVQVYVKGNTEVGNTFVRFYSEQDKSVNAILRFPQNSSVISSLGNNTATLTVEIPKNLTKEQIGDTKRLLLPIAANISFPTTITNREGDTFSNNASIGVSEATNLTLAIMPPLEIDDHIQMGLENATKAISPIAGLWTLLIPLVGGVSSLIIYLWKKKRKPGTI